MIRHLDLFSGIGGFALAAQMVGGIETKQFVEIDPYCQQVLAKNYPTVPIHDDITTYTAKSGLYDLITAGFPCQPHSLAGKRKASQDSRDLWGELYRVICEARPRWVVLENVPGLITSESGSFFKRILWQLAEAGFDVEWGTVSCQALGGVHKRERLWIVATHSQSQRCHTLRYQDLQARSDLTPECSSDKATTDTSSEGLEGSRLTWSTTHSFTGEGQSTTDLPRVPRGDDGLSVGLHQPYLMSPTDLPKWLPYATDGIKNHPERNSRMKALGNAVVPHVAAIALRRIFN